MIFSLYQKKKYGHPRILFPVKLSFKNKRGNKIFPTKLKEFIIMKKFITIKSALQEMLKGFLWVEVKEC